MKTLYLVFDQLDKIPQDKVRHFTGGAILMSCALFLGPVKAEAIVSGFAIGKEALDATVGKKYGHVASWGDAAATILGTLPPLAAYLLGAHS